jgi:hypothetical protein
VDADPIDPVQLTAFLLRECIQMAVAYLVVALLEGEARIRKQFRSSQSLIR